MIDSLIDDYKKSDFGYQFENGMYPIFEEIVTNPKIKKWMEWDNDIYKPKNQYNKERLFKWLSKVDIYIDEKHPERGKTELDRIVTKSRDIKEISKFIFEERAIQKMEDTRSIIDAYLSSDQVGTDKFDNALEEIDKQILEAQKFSSYAKKESKTKLQELFRKLQNIVVGKGFTDIIFNKNKERDTFINCPNMGFSEIELIDFKQFEQLKINDINKINIFAGNNNSGKTSVLEAIYLITKQNDLNTFFDMNIRRGKFQGRLPSDWLNSEFDKKYHIKAMFDKKHVEYKACMYKETTGEINKSYYSFSVKIDTEFESERQKGLAHVFENETKFDAQSIKWISNASFSSPFSLQNQEDMVFCHEKSVLLKTYDRIIEFIKKHIDDGIENIIYTGETNRFQVYHNSFSNPVDITRFGEGVQRIFYISLQVASAKNGVMCIDEIENAIHHSLFSEFIKFLLTLAEECNVQLFISSHNDEFITAFFDEQIEVSKISAFRLERTHNKTTIKHVSGEKYARLRKNFKSDLRG